MKRVSYQTCGRRIHLCHSDFNLGPSSCHYVAMKIFFFASDAWCRLVFIDSSFAGATNDIVAYHQTMMYICSAFMDEKFCLALDEAYSSIKDGKHLTPFSNGQLQAAWEAGDYSLYSKMRCFNQVFCSQWITIERAFGQLVRRWGIFW